MKISLNSDRLQFHHYHQSKKSPLTSLHMTLEFHMLSCDAVRLLDSRKARSM